MEIGQWYWIILVIWALFYGYGNWGPEGNRRYGMAGSGVVLLILLILIGLKIMGSVVK